MILLTIVGKQLRHEMIGSVTPVHPSGLHISDGFDQTLTGTSAGFFQPLSIMFSTTTLPYRSTSASGREGMAFKQ